MKRKYSQLVTGAGVAALLLGASVASAQTAPSLGAAHGYAVLAGSTITNTGPSIITGDLGLHPGGSVTGFPPGLILGGAAHIGDAAALAAKNSLTTAYNNLAGQACTANLTGQDLGGLILTPGVYCFDTSAGLTGLLTLNALGNPAAVFIFKMGSTLTTASGSSVQVINGGSACNVFWQVGSSATLGTTTTFAGNILALTSITLTTGANVSGRTLARNGAVTLDTNNVNASACTTGLPPGCPDVTINPPVLPPGTVGAAYSQTLTGSGGTAPYTFVVRSGTLPAGLTLTPGGLLSGTPTTAGTSIVTIRGTDVNGCFGERVYAITVTVPVPTLPQAFAALLALGLTGLGYVRLRRQTGRRKDTL